jgi:hypothetical protein
MSHHSITHHSSKVNDSHTHHTHSDINHDWDSDDDYTIGKAANKIIWKVLADTLYTTSFDFSYSNFYFFDSENLYKKEYPPNYYRHIKNYSYADTIKIIKSNT